MLDTGFTKFVTERVVKVLWGAALIIAALAVAAALISALITRDVTNTLGALVFGPLVAGIWLLLVRVWLELIMVVFRIADNTTAIAERLATPTDWPRVVQQATRSPEEILANQAEIRERTRGAKM